MNSKKSQATCPHPVRVCTGRGQRCTRCDAYLGTLEELRPAKPTRLKLHPALARALVLVCVFAPWRETSVSAADNCPIEFTVGEPTPAPDLEKLKADLAATAKRAEQDAARAAAAAIEAAIPELAADVNHALVAGYSAVLAALASMLIATRRSSSPPSSPAAPLRSPPYK